MSINGYMISRLFVLVKQFSLMLFVPIHVRAKAKKTDKKQPQKYCQCISHHCQYQQLLAKPPLNFVHQELYRLCTAGH